VTVTEASELKGPLRIYYHGTSIDNLETIRTHGFQAWTYFADHLADALEYGGELVFEVVFEDNIETALSDEPWQFRVEEPVPSSRIVRIKTYAVCDLYSDTKLQRQLAESNQ